MGQIWRGRSQCSLEDGLQDWKSMRVARYDGRRTAGDAIWNLTRRWGAGMRTSWWACIGVGAILTCSAAYQHFKQPSLPIGMGAPEQSERHAVEQKPEQSLTYQDGKPSQDVNS